MKSSLVLCSILLVSLIANAQKGHKKKRSTAAGTISFYWGYNRSWYTNSTIRFVGSDYDFKLKGASASDRPDKFRTSVYFNPKTITVPQYNARIGYYFKDKWQISFGVDHMKYVLDDQNEVSLNGYIKPGIDTVWSGDYFNQPVVTDRTSFHYENTNGVNFLRFELMRSFDLWELGKKRQLALTGNLGVGVGPMLTFNDLNFAGEHSFATPSISGYGVGVNGALRLEFFKHVFVQAETGLGISHLTHVRTRPNDRNQFARQAFGFSQYFVAAGVLFYIRPKNGCDTCPNW
jgi:hypothetical protein